MNKNEFIAAVADSAHLEKMALSKGAVAAVIEAALAAVENALQRGDEVRLTGFGNFYVARRAASKGRHPRTGADIDIRAAKTPKFKAGKLLKEAINGPARKLSSPSAASAKTSRGTGS